MAIKFGSFTIKSSESIVEQLKSIELLYADARNLLDKEDRTEEEINYASLVIFFVHKIWCHIQSITYQSFVSNDTEFVNKLVSCKVDCAVDDFYIFSYIALPFYRQRYKDYESGEVGIRYSKLNITLAVDALLKCKELDSMEEAINGLKAMVEPVEEELLQIIKPILLDRDIDSVKKRCSFEYKQINGKVFDRPKLDLKYINPGMFRMLRQGMPGRYVPNRIRQLMDDNVMDKDVYHLWNSRNILGFEKQNESYPVHFKFIDYVEMYDTNFYKGYMSRKIHKIKLMFEHAKFLFKNFRLVPILVRVEDKNTSQYSAWYICVHIRTLYVYSAMVHESEIGRGAFTRKELMHIYDFLEGIKDKKVELNEDTAE